ncbi:MAG: DUF2239 family protein [Desulfarculaceae bacterium]|nr:DUF2239 family protein [Desulfarculaceae bacterium]MCF8048590.1 DUF2239 family protein [Desulfarculaceae bacterium]MCF8065391.1 DUF2239 family protein [Desulfarculaceae bacterium]MCF8123186.1 DUF2239 family protein [Desulfarculaceae bacterium]
MDKLETISCAAFQGDRCIASGDLLDVALKVKQALKQKEPTSVLIFDDFTGEPVEIDFRGTVDEVLQRLPQPQAVAPSEPEPKKEAPRGPGRPKLGVVSREVTLLPRHWDWLASQPGGASVTLRKLVEKARLANQERDKARQAQEAAYRFMSAVAGNLPGFEEATRALFKGDGEKFGRQTEDWPGDIRDFARKLARPAFQAS